jgi:hypothetical protein
MADEMSSAVTHGLALVSGGGLSGLVVRLLAGSFLKRLDDIEKTLKELVEKSDKRHEALLERLVHVEGKADAAHRRIDELSRRRR